MWIKICANTTVEDALAAAELGADAVGFVFATSPRRVSAAHVGRIAAELPDAVERVGVFAGSTIEEIRAIVDEARLHAVQLHDAFDPTFSRLLRTRLPRNVSIIQTLHWMVSAEKAATIANLTRIQAEMAAIAGALGEPQHGDQPVADDRVLLDAKVGAVSGGLGVSFDWEHARALSVVEPTLRTIVAGGLAPDNVSHAIHMLQPWGVDVASGVEAKPGVKDYGRLRTFIEQARGAVRLAQPG